MLVGRGVEHESRVLRRPCRQNDDTCLLNLLLFVGVVIFDGGGLRSVGAGKNARYRRIGADFGARFLFFDNRERLYEKREAGELRVMLRGDNWQLYRGLDAADSTVIGSFNPFLFFEFALVVPYVALAASQDAPSALPAPASQTPQRPTSRSWRNCATS